MKLEYKYTLGEDYYIIDSWKVRLRVRLTGVKFDGNNILYTYTHGKVHEVEESNIASTLEEAKERCLNNLNNYVAETRKEITNLTEMDF